MIRFVNFLRNTSHFLAAALLALLPVVVAADFGGMLPWTKMIASLAVAVILALAVAGLGVGSLVGGRRQLGFLILSLWCGYTYLQTVPADESVVRSVSPAAADAYTSWLRPVVPPELAPDAFPVSVSRVDTRYALSMLCLVAAVTWACCVVFTTRNRIVLLLTVISLGGSLHAITGFARLLFPELTLEQWLPTYQGSTFGTFINRNNAALFMNLGMAASLGLLCWRLVALTGVEVDNDNFDFGDLGTLFGDRNSFIGIFGIVSCFSALLICGSRGGFLAAIIGLALAFGWVRPSRGAVKFPVVLSIIGIAIAILLIPANLNTRTLTRLQVFTDPDAKSLMNDGRLAHWPDAVEAGKAYFPGGSGLGTYSYAYLPFQNSQLDDTTIRTAWFVHADNLWLEAFVEQGVVGITLAVLLVSLTLYCLHLLHRSPDPIDNGLRIAGWYAIAAVVISQIFDFGLIVPGNLFAATVLLAGLTARAFLVGGVAPISAGEDADWYEDHPDPDAEYEGDFEAVDPELDEEFLAKVKAEMAEPHRSGGKQAQTTPRTPARAIGGVFQRFGHLVVGTIFSGLVMCLLACGLCGFAVMQLRQAAADDLTVRTFKHDKDLLVGQSGEIDQWIDDVQARIDANAEMPWDVSVPVTTHLALADLHTLRARLTLATENTVASLDEQRSIYESTEPEVLRRFWFQSEFGRLRDDLNAESEGESGAAGESENSSEAGDADGAGKDTAMGTSAVDSPDTAVDAPESGTDEARDEAAVAGTIVPNADGIAMQADVGLLVASGLISAKAAPDYAAIPSSFMQALAICPLNRVARFELAQIDFLTRTERRDVLSRQLTRLYAQSPRTLLRIAELAAEAGRLDEAAATYRLALSASPRSATAVLQSAVAFNLRPLKRILPANPLIHELAAAYALRDVAANSDLLEYLAEQKLVGTANVTTSDQRAAKLELAADVAYAVGQQDEAFETYERAIAASPMRVKLRMKLIDRLDENGFRKEAKHQARVARSTMPNDKRFDKRLAKIAADEVAEAEASYQGEDGSSVESVLNDE